MAPNKMRVYVLSPKVYSQEVIAVTFAKTSRSPLPFDAIAAELNEPESARFHEKWVIGYGHASVAEHAVIHLAVEGLSRLATEALQSSRLASYTEKSSRYQPFGPDDFVLPPELRAAPAQQDLYRQTVQALLAAYRRCLEVVRAEVARRHPRRQGESETRWDARIRSKYADVCRFLLPAAAQTNVGLTVNARALAHLLRKLLSHPLAEVRTLGEEIKRVALAEVPTLVRYVEPVAHWQQAAQALTERAAQAPQAPPAADWCRLVHFDPDGEERVLAAALYRFGQTDYPAARAYVSRLDPGARQALVEALLGSLAEHDIPLRELEYATYVFDCVMDQGAYYEFKRHRMMTQTPQRLTAWWGYAVPRLVRQAGMEAAYRQAMEAAGEAYRRLAAWNPEVAAYVVPNGYNRRVLAAFNLREAYHFLALRSAPNAHFSIRRVALRMAAEIRRVHPALSAYVRLPEETWQAVEAAHFVDPGVPGR